MASLNPDQPNILFILSDDQGAWAMSCAGNSELSTPNLDRLAATGVRFENFFCASPVCSPARASILTGQIPSQHGVQDFLRKGNSEFVQKDGMEINYMEGRTSYVQELSRNGYVCGLSGKWHLGNARLPQFGFDYWNVHAAGGGDYYRAPMIENDNFYQPEQYVTDVITDHALDFLEDQKDSKAPFSLNVHYTAPHAPWTRENHPKKIFDDYYENSAFDSLPIEEIHPNQLDKDSSSATIGNNVENRKAALSGYFTAIGEMDRNIGRILDWLQGNEMLQNTLVIFTADNGMNMGHHGIWGKGNGTYPPNMFDTAVKIPTLISRPGYIPQGVVCDELLSQYDFSPTILDYVGIDHKDDAELPGTSFSNLLMDKPFGRNKPVFVMDEYGPTRMIRTSAWKYVHRYNDDPNELYDLNNDPEEVSNLFEDPNYEEIIQDLFEKLERWYEEYTDPIMDGRKNAVKGRGQIGRVYDSDKPFADDVVFFRDA